MRCLNSSVRAREPPEGRMDARLSFGDSDFIALCVLQKCVRSAFIAHWVAASNSCRESCTESLEVCKTFDTRTATDWRFQSNEETSFMDVTNVRTQHMLQRWVENAPHIARRQIFRSRGYECCSERSEGYAWEAEGAYWAVGGVLQ